MIVNVISAQYIDNFKINLSLKLIGNNSTEILEKTVNLENYIKSKKQDGIFAPLKEIDYFKKFKLNANTIEWQNGADIAPERFLDCCENL